MEKGTALFLYDAQLRELPKEIGALSRLTKLSLENNKLRELPKEIGALSSLSELSLSDNQLRELPKEIGALSRLRQLHLSNNQLRELPKEIGDLFWLTELYLNNNQLRQLPEELRKLPSLTQLFLHGNSELGIPDSILGSTWEDVSVRKATPADPKAILDYYFRTRAEGGRALNEVKLLLVGRGAAGKTSLSRALRGEPFDQNQAETPGIAIRPWEVACEGRIVMVHMWDFAGQEITHETHRFFLTERSVYVVALDGRGGQQMEEAEYWLDHVRKFGTTRRSDGTEETSPVIVALNKWKTSGPYEVEKRRLQREYPFIRAFVETDCQPGKEGPAHGVEKLRETLYGVIESMEGVKQIWPHSYQRVRDALTEKQAQGANYVTWAEYREVCERSGLPKAPEQQALAENLNALGLALYYGSNERLRDTRVLRPDWVANGLYAIIRGVAKRGGTKRQGQLLRGGFRAVLEAGLEGMDGRAAALKDYPEETWDFLLELLLDRELAFPMAEKRDLYLLPALLPLDEPEDYDVGAHLEGAQVKFRYLYELLPAGVMSRFIVRTHMLSEALPRWSRGVILEWEGARALLLAERRKNPRVDVYIRGGTERDRQQLSGIVRANLGAIHDSLPEGMRGKEELDLRMPGEQFVEVEKLVALEKAGEPLQVVLPGGKLASSPATPELEQVQPASARANDAPKLRLFVSYSHDDHKQCELLKPHLSVMEGEGLLSWWRDSKLVAGDLWDKEIRREVAEADIIVLLVSISFLNSGYIQSVELAKARERHEQGLAVVVPVLIHECPGFSNHAWLKSLQAAPTVDGRLKPIVSFNRHRKGWTEVELALRTVIAEFAKRRGRLR